MSIETVAVISPGDMGHVVARVIRDKGLRVITNLVGRSKLSCARASRSGMEDVGSLSAVLGEADAVLSIMPPEFAFSFIESIVSITSKNAPSVFADCNAVSPVTTEKMREISEVSGLNFVKIGIVGPPPGQVGAGAR